MKTRRNAPDKELIRERTLDVLAYYLNAPGKDQGSRVVWDCPSCNKAEKFAVKKAERKGGCLVAGCRLEGYEDVFSLVARFEDLDCRTDFLQVLQKAYDALGLDPDALNNGQRKRQKQYSREEGASRRGSGSARTVSLKGRARDHSHMEATTSGDAGPEAARGCDQAEIRELSGRAYERIMGLCPLESRDRRYLRTRGLSYETIMRGRFGTMTAARAREVKAALQRELGREALLSVPGFSEDEETGRLKFTLSGDYLLIPYHDAEGRITTIEGRVAGKVPEGMGKYVSLRRAGNHLYVFPGHEPGSLLAVCEGAMGAIVAAEAGLSVGAIQGCERYRASLSPDFPDGEPGDPLLELMGADFGGRTLVYVPDADDPPNPRVLRAAPEASRCLAEPRNARPAICLLPDGMDLDEWLLTLEPDERRCRFEELLRIAGPPEDGGSSHVTGGEVLPRISERAAVSTESSEASERVSPDASGDRGRDEGDTSDEATSEPSGEETSPPLEEDRSRSARRASRGTRKLRDEVYRVLLGMLPPKEAHVGALSRRGVMREAAIVGRLGSFDEERAGGVTAGLVDRFGAKRLLSVPGFERAGSEGVRFALSGEHLLLPCFDGEGLLSAVEALPVDEETGEVSGEETVPLPGAGGHLYVFAAYRPEELEGFCEGSLGVLLAAQDDVVLGGVGGFRRYRVATGPSPGRQPEGSVLPELDGVDFAGRDVAYVPRTGAAVGEENARYHEAESAARWLVERQGGRPGVAAVGDAGREAAPSSLAGWILSLPEDETREKLRELFPESPRRRTRTGPGSDDRRDERAEAEPEGEGSPPVPIRLVAVPVVVGAVFALGLYVALVCLQGFSEYLGTRPSGERIPEGALLGALRALASSPPLEFLYTVPVATAVLAGTGAGLLVWRRARRAYLGRRAAEQTRVAERWKLHERPRKEPPTAVPVTPAEAGWAALAWPLVYLASGWTLMTTERLLDLAIDLGLAPATGPLVTDPVPVQAAAATLAAAFVLGRRRAIRVEEARMLGGKINH